ncbi:MAG: hypothetical protein E6Q97_30400 [Desulfurellales bacterium]|nr:MAG: hypothetical protein E6Q97_30400 [Desulfurellales bacterium]
MKIPTTPAIKDLFALAMPYDEKKPPAWPVYATPKLNGVRAMWVPGLGFFSRDGAAYEPGILPHIEAELQPSDLWIDGEFYCHGMHLQDINSRAGVVRKTPHKDAGAIKFHAFDLIHMPGTFVQRQARLQKLLAVLGNKHVVQVDNRVCGCERKADAFHKTYVSEGYEGTVYKQAGGYVGGRSRMMLKRKGWIDDDFAVVRLVEGAGKHIASLGAAVLRTAAGVEFEVGSFALNDDQRLDVWIGPKPASAKVKYLGLTADGRPFHAQVLAFA